MCVKVQEPTNLFENVHAHICREVWDGWSSEVGNGYFGEGLRAQRPPLLITFQGHVLRT